MTEREEILRRAKGYPYSRAPGSFVFTNEEVREPGLELSAGRTPVLAYGSNASPVQLRRKFGDWPGKVEIFTQRVHLRGFDIVYAPMFAYYGSVPATLVPSPGTVVDTWVQYLDSPLLARMHETEGEGRIYAFEPLPEGAVQVAGCHAYRALDGALLVGDGPAALAEVSAEGRVFPALTQVEVLQYAMEALGVAGDLDRFILETVRDPTVRGERWAALPRVPAD